MLSLFSRNELADSCDFGGGLDPEIYQRVGEFGHDFGQFQGVAFRKVVLSFVRKFVAGISAGIANLFNVVRDTSFLSEKLNLFPKHGLRFVIGDLAALGNVVGQLLQTDPKQYTCASGRKGNNALRFKEFFQSFFRHVTRRSNPPWSRISNFSVIPIAEFSAAQATGNETVGMILEARSSAGDGRVPDNSEFNLFRACDRVGKHVDTDIGIESVYNRKNRESSFSPAVRAYIGAFHE